MQMRKFGIVLGIMFAITSGYSQIRGGKEVLVFADHSGSVEKFKEFYDFAGSKVEEILGYLPQDVRVKIFHYAANVKLYGEVNVDDFKNSMLYPSILDSQERKYTFHKNLVNVIEDEKKSYNVLMAFVLTDGKSSPPKPLKDIDFKDISVLTGIPVLWLKPDSTIVLLNGDKQLPVSDLSVVIGLLVEKGNKSVYIIVAILMLVLLTGGYFFVMRKKERQGNAVLEDRPEPKWAYRTNPREKEVYSYKDKLVFTNRDVSMQEKSSEPYTDFIELSGFYVDTISIKLEKIRKGNSSFVKITNSSTVPIVVSMGQRVKVDGLGDSTKIRWSARMKIVKVFIMTSTGEEKFAFEFRVL